MIFEQFCEQIASHISLLLGADYHVQIAHVEKNNGRTLHGLCIRKNDEILAPTIYLEQFYDHYLDGMTMEECIREFLLVYERREITKVPDFSFYNDYSLVKQHLAFRLVNREKNKELLENVAHVPYLDLAILFFCPLEMGDNGNASVTVRKEHLERWNVTPEVLLADAQENAVKILPAEVLPIEAMLKELLGDNVPEKFGNAKKEMIGSPLYVLTNAKRYMGASAVLYPDLLAREASRLESDLYVLPSSIHEMLFLPALTEDSSYLLNIVREVNQNEISEEDYLSDTVYRFDRASGKLRIVSTYRSMDSSELKKAKSDSPEC